MQNVDGISESSGASVIEAEAIIDEGSVLGGGSGSLQGGEYCSGSMLIPATVGCRFEPRQTCWPLWKGGRLIPEQDFPALRRTPMSKQT